MTNDQNNVHTANYFGHSSDIKVNYMVHNFVKIRQARPLMMFWSSSGY